MNPATRIIAAGSLFAVVLAAALAANQRGDGPDTFLMGRQSFSATQLRDMEAAFGKAGLVDYQIDGDCVRVPSGQQSKYMAALVDGGAMPEDFGEFRRQAVNSGGFMVSRSRQEAQTKVALESEMQLVISRMKGIKRASVLIAEEVSRGFPQTKTVTASVAIEPRDERPIDEATIADIRSYVASSWAGLKPEAVTVVKTNHEPSRVDRKPAVAQSALPWIAENWQPLSIGGLMLVGLVMAWSTMRAAPRAATPETAPALRAPEPQQTPGNVETTWSEDAPLHTVVRPGVSDSLRKELTVMIRQDPQTAAGVLRTWIGTPS